MAEIGKLTIAWRPIRTRFSSTPLGSRVACSVWLRIASRRRRRVVGKVGVGVALDHRQAAR